MRRQKETSRSRSLRLRTSRKRRLSRSQKSNKSSSKVKFRSSKQLSPRWLPRSKWSRRITRTLSMREIFSELNWSEEMTNWLSFTRRLKSCNRPWPEVKSSTRKDWRTSDFSSSRSVITRVSWESLSLKPLRSQISEKRFTTYNSSCSLRDFRSRLFLRNLRIHWTPTDGEDLKELIQTLGRCYRRFKPCRSVSSRRQNRSWRKTFTFRRKKNCTLSSRICWRDSLVQRLLSSSQSTSKT